MSIKVVGIPGSLREGSFNKGLLRSAIELVPAGMEIQIFTRLGDIPPYNADVDDKGNPEPVQALKAAIRETDAIPDRDAGVQLWCTGGTEECHRLGFAAGGSIRPQP